MRTALSPDEIKKLNLQKAKNRSTRESKVFQVSLDTLGLKTQERESSKAAALFVGELLKSFQPCLIGKRGETRQSYRAM